MGLPATSLIRLLSNASLAERKFLEQYVCKFFMIYFTHFLTVAQYSLLCGQHASAALMDVHGRMRSRACGPCTERLFGSMGLKHALCSLSFTEIVHSERSLSV